MGTDGHRLIGLLPGLAKGVLGTPGGTWTPLHGKWGPQPAGMAPLAHSFSGASAQGCGWGLHPARGTPATRPCWGSPRLPLTLHPFVRGGSVCWAAPSPLIEAVSPGGSPGPINRACVRRAVPRRSTMAGHSARPAALGHLPAPRSSGQTLLTPPSPLCDIAGTPADGRFPCPPSSCCSRGAASPHPIARSQSCDPALPSPPPRGRGGGVPEVPPLCCAMPWASQPAACAHRARVSGAAASVQLRARAARWGRLRQRRVPGTPERGYLLLGSAAARPQL